MDLDIVSTAKDCLSFLSTTLRADRCFRDLSTREMIECELIVCLTTSDTELNAGKLNFEKSNYNILTPCGCSVSTRG